MNDNLTTIKAITELLCTGMVTEPDKLRVEVSAHGDGSMVSVEVLKARVDQPKLIGKDGANIKAIKIIVIRAGSLLGLNVELAIPDQDSKRISRLHPFKPNKHWDSDKMTQEIRRVCASVFNCPFTLFCTDHTHATIYDLGVSENENAYCPNLPDVLHSIDRVFRCHGWNQGREIKFVFGVNYES